MTLNVDDKKKKEVNFEEVITMIRVQKWFENRTCLFSRDIANCGRARETAKNEKKKEKKTF